MTAVSKNVYIDQSADIVNDYNNTYHRKFKKKPINVSSSTYIDFGKKIIKKKLRLVLKMLEHFCKRLHSKVD